MEDEPGVADQVHGWIPRGRGGMGGVIGWEDGRAHAAGSSRSDRPVWRRKTSSRLGRASVMVWADRPAAVEDPQDLRDGRVALVDIEADELVLAARLADEGLIADGGQDPLAIAVDAERDHVAGDLALERVGRALRDDHPVVDDREPVGERVGLLEVVRRQEDGRAVLAEGADLIPHAGARLGVEAGRRLVEEQHLRPVDDAEPDVESTPHPARVRAGRPVRGGLEVQCGQHLGRPRPAPSACPSRTAGPGGPARRVPSRPGRSTRPVARSRSAGGRSAVRVPGRPRRRWPVPALGGSRVASIRRVVVLPAPFGPEEAEDLPRFDRQVDAAHGLDRAAACLERPSEVVGLDHRTAGSIGSGHLAVSCRALSCLRDTCAAQRFGSLSALRR